MTENKLTHISILSTLVSLVVFILLSPEGEERIILFSLMFPSLLIYLKFSIKMYISAIISLTLIYIANLTLIWFSDDPAAIMALLLFFYVEIALFLLSLLLLCFKPKTLMGRPISSYLSGVYMVLASLILLILGFTVLKLIFGSH